MKPKLIYLFLLLLLFSISCDPDNPEIVEPEPEEEILEIPDEHFKNALVNTNSIDINGDGVGDRTIDLNNDGEVQRSEGELIQALILHFKYYEFGRYVDLTGIENFVNLKYLKMTGDHAFEENENGLISYDLSKLKKLEFLELSNLGTNKFQSIDLHGLDKLAEIKIINSRPDYSVDGDEFGDPDNFVDINLEGASGLKELYIHNSFLNIDFCQIPSLEKLEYSYLEGGEPEVFDFHCLTNLEWLDISDNHIVSLILKNSSVLNTLIARDIGYGEDGFANYYYLEHICIDDIPEEFEQIASLRDENTVVVTDCEF